MSLLGRYLLRTFGPIFGLALILMTSILLMGYFVRLFDVAILKGIALGWILQCFSLLLPYLLSLALPMAFLVALLMSLGHLSESGEMLALRASGFSPREILSPYLLLSLALSVLLVWFNHSLSPAGLRKFKDRLSQALSQISEVDPEPRTFVDLGDWKLYAASVDRRRKTLGGVRLFRRRGETVVVNAKAGRYQVRPGEGVVLRLEEGSLSRTSPGDDSRATVARFQGYRVFIPLLPASSSRTRSPDIQERTSADLRSMLAVPRPDRDRWALETELAFRTALAVSPFVFFWVGFPLGLGLERQGRARGFALSLLILFGYYGLVMLGIALGRRNGSLSAAAPWGADFFCLAAGLVLARRGLGN